LFLSAGGVISWLSKKQAVVALSPSEAEYIALCSAAQEAVWLRRLLNSFQEIPDAVVLMEDNQGAIALSQNPVEHARTKHVDIRYHFVREVVEKRLIELKYCSSCDMIADVLTKPLSAGQFKKLRFAMGLDSMPQSTKYVGELLYFGAIIGRL